MITKQPIRRRKSIALRPLPDARVILARRLDLMAGIELQHGHHVAAERLAWRAAQLREGAR